MRRFDQVQSSVKDHIKAKDLIDLRSQCPHFRILVIGRANAGKTTLLKKVCYSIEEPQIFNPSGEKIDPIIVEGSAERGMHDIENQLVFKSNPGFIFHDSRGFESGSENETKKVKSFISQRAASTVLREQLHAIWYCLPLDTNRPLMNADEEFFNELGTGKVPVIAIFTKFDALATQSFADLRESGLNRKDAKDRESEVAQTTLKVNFVDRLASTKFAPSDYVRADDMRRVTTSCNELIDKTANALNDDTLRLLFVSVQQNNIDLCIRCALGGDITPQDDVEGVVEQILTYFPHIWRDCEYEKDLHEVKLEHEKLKEYFHHYYTQKLNANVRPCIASINRRLPSLKEAIKSRSGYAEFLAALCIFIEQTFTEGSAKNLGFVQAFEAAFDAYVGSKERGFAWGGEEPQDNRRALPYFQSLVPSPWQKLAHSASDIPKTGFDVYAGSPLRRSVNQEIVEWLKAKDMDDEESKVDKLYDIVIRHRLRLHETVRH